MASTASIWGSGLGTRAVQIEVLDRVLRQDAYAIALGDAIPLDTGRQAIHSLKELRMRDRSI
jgi:hypothetical protein